MIKNVNGFMRINQYRFGDTRQQQKILEIDNDEDFNDSSLDFIRNDETFQNIAADPNAVKRSTRADNIAYKRQYRQLRSVHESHHYAGILNAKSVNEIREQLQIIKNNTIKMQRKSRKESIMQILNNLAGDDNKDDKEDDDEKDLISLPRRMNYEVTNAYVKAMRQCGFLKEFNEGYKLFEEIKELRKAGPAAYAMLIWLKMEENVDRDTLEECYDIFTEMKDKEGLRPNAEVYTQLIRNATLLKSFRARELVKAVFNAGDYTKNLLQSRSLRNAILNYYAKTQQIQSGLCCVCVSVAYSPKNMCFQYVCAYIHIFSIKVYVSNGE